MNRALVLGSQIKGLRGVENDTRAMQTMLERRGFEVDLRTGDQATRAEFLDGYERLIERAGADDAAVVYYSGHGFYGAVPGETRPWQCIAPSDVDAGTERDFRGITAWELSILQARLTRKTRNVTVILDSCHSSQMSRDAAVREATPRALPHPRLLGFAAHLDALRARYGAEFDAVDPVGNPDAVRLVAAGQFESAFEYRSTGGEHRGVFTEALVDVLIELGDAEVSWVAIADAIRARVMRYFVTQRPDIEGPARRRPFSLIEVSDRGSVAVRRLGERLELNAGRLTGVVAGDVYGVVPVGRTGYDPSSAIAEVDVVEVRALSALAQVRQWQNGYSAIPVDAAAMPVVKNATKRAIAVDVPAAAQPSIVRAIEDTRTLRVADGAEPVVATLRLAGDQITIEDARGPLFPPARFPDELGGAIASLKNLAVAQAVRELEGEHGVYRREIDVEIGIVEAGRLRPLRDHRAALGLRDRFYIQVKNRGHRTLFAHVFNVGLQRKISLLTKTVSPAGVAVMDGSPPFVLGQRADGALLGIGIEWPAGLPRAGFPRLDEYFVVITSSRVSLATLETQAHVAGELSRIGGTPLQDLLAQLHDGLTRDAENDLAMEGFLLERLSYLLYPYLGAMGGLVFEIDENPSGQAAARDPSAWLSRRVGVAEPTVAPGPIDVLAIQIADLVVNTNRTPSAADVRVDALICTRAADGRPGHATWTHKYTGIRSGQRLALENGLLYRGPLRDFVDIVLFVSRDRSGGPDLATLFAERANTREFQEVAAALQADADAQAPWVTAVGASAVLAHMAHELVLGVAGKSTPLYRTSFLQYERFGTGRHPEEGLYHAQELSFSLLIEPVELQRGS